MPERCPVKNSGTTWKIKKPFWSLEARVYRFLLIIELLGSRCTVRSTLRSLKKSDLVKHEGNEMELAVVNPTSVLGPVLSDDFSHSIHTIKQMLNEEMKACRN